MVPGTAGSTTNLRVPHPLRSLQRVGYATVGSRFHPSQTAQRIGPPEICGTICRIASKAIGNPV
jgi:hypothetical protein